MVLIKGLYTHLYNCEAAVAARPSFPRVFLCWVAVKEMNLSYNNMCI